MLLIFIICMAQLLFWAGLAQSIAPMEFIERFRLPWSPVWSVRTHPDELLLEPGCPGWLAHSIYLRASDRCHFTVDCFRLGRDQGLQKPSGTAARIPERCRTHSCSHWRGMGQFRHLGLLPAATIESLRGYPALAACAPNSPVAISGLLAALATDFLLSHVPVPLAYCSRRCSSWPGRSSSPQFQSPSDFRHDCHYTLGHGHELPQHHDSSQQ